MDDTDDTFAEVDAALHRLSQFAARIDDADSGRHVCRSVEELRTAFATRAPVEPAVHRVRRSLELLTSAGTGGLRRQFIHDALGLDRVEMALEVELLPALRRIGFEV